MKRDFDFHIISCVNELLLHELSLPMRLMHTFVRCCFAVHWRLVQRAVVPDAVVSR